MKEGWVLAPFLFAIFFSILLSAAFSEYRFNRRAWTAAIYSSWEDFKPKQRSKWEYIYLQTILNWLRKVSQTYNWSTVNDFARAVQQFGLTISLKRRNGVQNKPGTQNDTGHSLVTIKDEPLKVVENSCYLGSILRQAATMNANITVRIANDGSAFGRLFVGQS